MYFKLYSSNIFSLIYEGASVSGSSPDCVLGNGITSLIEFWLYTSAIKVVFNKFKTEKCSTFKQNPKPMSETSGKTSRN